MFALATLSTSAAPLSIGADADSGTVSISYHRMVGGPDNASNHLIRSGVVTNPKYAIKTNEQIVDIYSKGVNSTSNTELNIRQLPGSDPTGGILDPHPMSGTGDSLPVPNMTGPMHGLPPCTMQHVM